MSPSPTKRRAPAPRRGAPTKRRRRRPQVRRWALTGVAAVVAVAIGAFAALWVWAVLPGPGAGKVVILDWPARGGSGTAAGRRLAEHGVVRSPRLFAAYLALVRPSVELLPGRHLLNDGLSPREVVQRLARLPSRPSHKVTVPEGFHLVQLAERLEKSEICAADHFRRVAFSRALRDELGVRGPSVEGFLFPATYELAVDSTPEAVIRTMVRTGRQRLRKLSDKHGAALQRLEKERGWSEHEVVTLASIVEREAARADERRRIASVYFNRLDDPEFKPRGTLQADPTAAYGCVVEPEAAPSCAAFTGKVTPALLRDAKNRYNTYKFAGLPPGPIANPGEGALEAVLSPEQTDFLFFVATGDGRHAFSRTLDEHNRAIRKE